MQITSFYISIVENYKPISDVSQCFDKNNRVRERERKREIKSENKKVGWRVCLNSNGKTKLKM